MMGTTTAFLAGFSPKNALFYYYSLVRKWKLFDIVFLDSTIQIVYSVITVHISVAVTSGMLTKPTLYKSRDSVKNLWIRIGKLSSFSYVAILA